MAKKFFLLSLLLTAFTAITFCQVKLGVMGGPQSATIRETNQIAGWDTATGRYYKGKSGIHIGVMAEIPLSPSSRFFFEPAVLYSQKGRSFSKNTVRQYPDSINGIDTSVIAISTQQLTIQYIDIPLNFAYKLPLSKKNTTHLLISAGPYLSMFFNGKTASTQRNTTSFDTIHIIKSSNTSHDLEVGKKEDSYRTLGYGINARAGLEIGNVTLSAFVSQGLDNLYYAAYSGTFKHRVYGASLGLWLGKLKEPVIIKDKDGDGLTDDKDACPLEAGSAITNGCPDKDADGVADNKDKCPGIPGLVKYEGCPVPDSDMDGVDDEADKCPAVAGLARYNGCPIPDSDQDGVNDEEDKCPQTAGVAKYKGCPVPDTDHDGVNDEADQCPDVAGLASNNGCPVIKEEISKQVQFAAENIFFKLNSAELLGKSFAGLDTVVAVLKQNPLISLTIEGHTDNTGSSAANLLISAKRAMAVKNYMVKNGVEASRITTNGLGQTQPIADNHTAAGRAKNRRVELKLSH